VIAATFVVTRVAIARTSVVIGSIVDSLEAAVRGTAVCLDPESDASRGAALPTRMGDQGGRSSCPDYVIRPRPARDGPRRAAPDAMMAS
jgi:hypothetical protein